MWPAMIYFGCAAIHCRVELTPAVQRLVASVFLASLQLSLGKTELSCSRKSFLPADLGKFAKLQVTLQTSRSVITVCASEKWTSSESGRLI
ncbi:Os09g0310800 [Oryza sativa Japonica Group]|uniref:Os09g0310800 protein n=2 Tax=Oryza sativa subsp. japonica TaxID=39947 RepID=Q0J2R5_ORYSJ|nr:Os09g0310800 [Oryza sativa Japonica Group]BAT07385.1 Os09g0310800 [Oryza sativa Japonica Group]|eukprot:NP_001062836.1 Os09g0310800 [Oryza sativa Japonica Group]